MLVATIRHLPDVSSKVLCLIGDNKKDMIAETISDAFRETVPSEWQDYLIINVDKVSDCMYIITSYTEDGGVLMHAPRAAIVTLSVQPIYGKD